jgi:threonine dehydrogenase-like Zn-dependent dehydrogenase
MKDAILFGDRDIGIGHVGDPRPGAGDVLIEVGHAGICGTDLHIFRGEFHDRVKVPAILGHEFGGEIVAVGADVTRWHRGDRVVVDPILSCHACSACLEGHINCCANLKLIGMHAT